jgi:poly(A) polymerase
VAAVVSERDDDTGVDVSGLIQRLAAFFAGRPTGGAAWLVGGTVRDAVLGREVHDIDLAVPGDAIPVGAAVADLLGGTVVPMPLRNVARVALTVGDDGRPPFVIDVAGFLGPFEADLKRRDFTINALGLPLSSWGPDWPMDDLVDPLGGRSDLARRTVRATGDYVFSDDPGRLLRGVRLAGQLGFRMQPETAQLIRRDAWMLERVAPERVRDEFMQLLAADGARAQLDILDRLGLLCRVIPELEAARGCEQPKAHHYWDVWGHLLHCVEFAEAITAGHRNNAIYTMAPWTAVEDAYFREYVGDGHTRRTVLKLAALLHDIAKPQTRGPDAKGRIRFLGHSEQGAEVSEVRLAALRMSGQIQSLVSKMVLHHLRPSQLRHGEQMPSSRAIYRYYRDLGPAAVDTLYLAMADFLAARGPELSPERWANYARMVAAVLEAGAGPPQREDGARALVNGNDLMNSLNIPPGPLVGRLLENLREAEATGEVATRDDALALAARLLRNGEGR